MGKEKEEEKEEKKVKEKKEEMRRVRKERGLFYPRHSLLDSLSYRNT